MTRLTIHAVYYGRALCGREGAPGTWGPDERWHAASAWRELADLIDGQPHLALCSECDERARALDSRPPLTPRLPLR